MARTGQLSPTLIRIETSKTGNKRAVFVFRPGDDAVLSEECANGHCLSTDGSFEWGRPKSANAGCCGHKDCGTPASEVCECLCHAGGEQVGTMLDGEPA